MRCSCSNLQAESQPSRFVALPSSQSSPSSSTLLPQVAPSIALTWESDPPRETQPAIAKINEAAARVEVVVNDAKCPSVFLFIRNVSCEEWNGEATEGKPL